MRFLIHEQGYEKPLAAGMFRYRLPAGGAGPVEHWRLTDAGSGFRFLRVDLDGRESSGDSTLYHLTWSGQWQPVRLQFRFWRAGLQVVGNVFFQDEGLVLARQVNGRRLEEETVAPALFWFPAVAGHALLAGAAPGAEGQPVPAWTLARPGGPEPAATPFALLPAELTFQWEQEETLAVTRRTRVVRPLLIRQAGRKRTLWLDAQGWPLKMESEDGLSAVETQNIRYETGWLPGRNAGKLASNA